MIRMKKATFSFFFLAIISTSFVSFCWSALISPGLMKEIFFPFSWLVLLIFVFLLRKSLRFLIPSLLAHHMSYLQLYHFLPCLKTGVNYRENNAFIMLICMQRSSFFKLFYCIEHIS